MQQATYGFRHALWRSWFSRSFYNDVARNWHGSGFGYLFCLLFVCSILVSAALSLDMRHTLSEWQRTWIKQLPTLTFKDGKMQTQSQQIQIIHDHEGMPFVVIDPTGQYSKKHMPDAPILLTTDAAYTVSADNNIREYTYTSLGNLEITADSANNMAEHAKYWGVFALCLSLLFFAYCYRIIVSFIYSILNALVIARIYKSPLLYPAILRITVIAQTPVILISTLGAVLGVSMTHAWILGVVINILYMCFGIKSASLSDAPAVSTEKAPPAV